MLYSRKRGRCTSASRRPRQSIRPYSDVGRSGSSGAPRVATSEFNTRPAAGSHGIDKSKEYSAAAIITAAMKVFAQDSRVVSIDADLASTSGLEAGIAAVDQNRALNVGVAEANMKPASARAFAALGYNTWDSAPFCPFSRIGRCCAGSPWGTRSGWRPWPQPDGWLSEGHGLDLTLVATAPDSETRTNGATHMGNDGHHHLRWLGPSEDRRYSPSFGNCSES